MENNIFSKSLKFQNKYREFYVRTVPKRLDPLRRNGLTRNNAIVPFFSGWRDRKLWTGGVKSHCLSLRNYVIDIIEKISIK